MTKKINFNESGIINNDLNLSELKNLFSILVNLNKYLKNTGDYINIDNELSKLIKIIYIDGIIDEKKLEESREIIINLYNRISELEFTGTTLNNETKIFLNLFNTKIRDLI
ncbi:MAG: hypothetical protein PHN31_00745 [Candidatus Gracilibacteria bacterium]|nr:hypothetical protein [Candidatus Gracilibacteria bacterium]